MRKEDSNMGAGRGRERKGEQGGCRERDMVRRREEKGGRKNTKRVV